MNGYAECPRCGNVAWLIFEDKISCTRCGNVIRFEFMDDAKIICETSANDILKLIEENG